MVDWRETERSIIDIALSLRNPREGCILFVGSGMSVEADLPTGRGLAEKLAEEIDYPFLTQMQLEEAIQQWCQECPRARDLLEELKKTWSCCGPLEPLAIIAQYFENESPGHRERLVELLRDLLERAKRVPTHELVTKFPFKAIYTTNYDTLLEDAYQQAGIEHSVITHDSQLSARGLKIVKLHGTVGPHCDKELVVITDEDYQDFKAEKRERVLAEMKEDLRRYHVVFVGYSLQDNHFRETYHHIRRLAGRYGKRCWAVIPDFHDYQANDLKKRYEVILIKRKAHEFFRELKEQYDRVAFEEFVPLARAVEQATDQPCKPVWHVDCGVAAPDKLRDRIKQVSEWITERHLCVSVNWAEAISPDPKESHYNFFAKVASALQRCKTGTPSYISDFSDMLSAHCREAAQQMYLESLITELRQRGHTDKEVVSWLPKNTQLPDEIRGAATQAWEETFLREASQSLMECLENLSPDRHLFLLLSGFESEKQGQNAENLLKHLARQAIARVEKLPHVTLILFYKGFDIDTILRYSEDRVKEVKLLPNEDSAG